MALRVPPPSGTPRPSQRKCRRRGSPTRLRASARCRGSAASRLRNLAFQRIRQPKDAPHAPRLHPPARWRLLRVGQSLRRGGAQVLVGERLGRHRSQAARRGPRRVEQGLPRARRGPGEGAGRGGGEEGRSLHGRGGWTGAGARGPAHRRVHPDLSRDQRCRPRHDRHPRADRGRPAVTRADHAPAGADRERQPPHAHAAVQRRINAHAARHARGRLSPFPARTRRA